MKKCCATRQILYVLPMLADRGEIVAGHIVVEEILARVKRQPIVGILNEGTEMVYAQPNYVWDLTQKQARRKSRGQ